MSNCEHRFIVTHGFIDGAHAGEVAMWSCQECGIRFYPACPVCVNVGHRQPIVHNPPAFSDAAPGRCNAPLPRTPGERCARKSGHRYEHRSAYAMANARRAHALDYVPAIR